MYWSRSWRLFAVVGKAGVSWSDFVVVVVEEAISFVRGVRSLDCALFFVVL